MQKERKFGNMDKLSQKGVDKKRLKKTLKRIADEKRKKREKAEKSEKKLLTNEAAGDIIKKLAKSGRSPKGKRAEGRENIENFIV